MKLAFHKALIYGNDDDNDHDDDNDDGNGYDYDLISTLIRIVFNNDSEGHNNNYDKNSSSAVNNILPRSTLHHAPWSFLVCVHDLPQYLAYLLPSTALDGDPPHPSEDCFVGLPKAMFTEEDKINTMINQLNSNLIPTKDFYDCVDNSQFMYICLRSYSFPVLSAICKV